MRKVSILIVGSFVLVLGAMFASAYASGPYFFTSSEGCDGSGITYPSGTYQLTSITSAQVSGTSNPCNWTFLSGNYQQTGGTWNYGVGPGWESDSPEGWTGIAVSGVQHADQVAHTACNPGGPCSGVKYVFTGY